MMLSQLKHPLLISCLLIAATVEALEKTGFSTPFIHWYLSDLVCMPIFLFLSEGLEGVATNNSSLKYDAPKIIAVWIVVSIVYEAILPSISEKFTRDLFDVIAYAAGAGGYYLYRKQVEPEFT